MARVIANDVHYASAADNLAVVTQSLDAGTDFHGAAAWCTFWAEPKAYQYKALAPTWTRPKS